MIKFVKLQKTVVVTIEGKSYPISNGHPMYDDVNSAIDNNNLEKLKAIVLHNDTQDFLSRLKIRNKKTD